MNSLCHSIDILKVSADCQTQSSAEGRGRNIGKVHGGHGGGHNGLCPWHFTNTYCSRWLTFCDPVD